VTWSPTSHSTAPPYYGTGAGTFVASGGISDSGDAAFAGQDVAVASPIVGMFQGSFTLTGQAGTLTLRCRQKSTDFSDPAAVPGSGSCAITDGTGTYGTVHGQGMATSLSDFTTPIPTQVITISLNIV
jgi:hypothetical protein